jgi:MraZ protein
MFRGTFEHSIDAKGRTSVPGKFRDLLADQAEARLVSTMDLEARCLHIRTLPEWEKVEQQLLKLPQLDPAVQHVRRFYVGSAQELEIDKMGRVLIPSTLREYARLTKDVIWSGQLSLIELWSKDGWKKAQASLASGEHAAEIARVLAELR